MKEYLIIELGIGYDERVKVTYRESNQTNIFVHSAARVQLCTLQKLRTNLEIAQWGYAISRLHGTSAQSRGTSAQSRDSAISVACTIEPFQLPSYIKVRDVRILQLRRHLQCRACILKPPHQGLLEVHQLGETPFPSGAERSQTCGVPPFKASSSLKVLNSLLLVSSDALTPLAHDVRKLHSRNLKIAQTYCAISRLSAQSRDWCAFFGF